MAVTDDAKTLPAQRPLFRLPGAWQAWLASEHAPTQRMAGAAFAIRVLSAGVVFISQILLARWMGSFEYGTYVYVWTWLLLVGDIVHLGLPLTAQRHIPDYTQRGLFDLLRGYLVGQPLDDVRTWHGGRAPRRAGWCDRSKHPSTATPSCRSTSPAWRCRFTPFPSCSTASRVPTTGSSLGLAAAFTAAPAAAARADRWGVTRPGLPWTRPPRCWRYGRRHLDHGDHAARRARPPAGSCGAARAHGPTMSARWFAISLPMITVWGFYTLLTTTDVLVLRQFRPAEEVAHYYAAAKTLDTRHLRLFRGGRVRRAPLHRLSCGRRS